MTDKDLRNLGRKELIEIIYEFQKREAEFQSTIKSLSEQLEVKEIQMEQAGSIAEAALVLNGIFESAQKAADQYLLSIKTANEHIAEETQKQLAEAKEQADALLKQGEDAYWAWVEKGQNEYFEKVAQAERQSEQARDTARPEPFVDQGQRHVFNYDSKELNKYA